MFSKKSLLYSSYNFLASFSSSSNILVSLFNSLNKYITKTVSSPGGSNPLNPLHSYNS
jgi:hypothetical protein